MLSNIQRIRIYIGSIAFVVLVAGIGFNVSAGARVDDIQLVTALRSFSMALEQYKLDFWKYPSGTNIDIRKNIVLTENGFAPGKKIYYHGSFDSSKPVVYASDTEGYSIDFVLRRSWKQEGFSSTRCRISERYTLKCAQ